MHECNAPQVVRNHIYSPLLALIRRDFHPVHVALESRRIKA